MALVGITFSLFSCLKRDESKVFQLRLQLALVFLKGKKRKFVRNHFQMSYLWSANFSQLTTSIPPEII